MQVILLEKIQNLGALGDQVNVKAGYARNFLLPQSKALPATAANIADFEQRRAELEKTAKTHLGAAMKRAESIEGVSVTIAANTADEGQLYGSIGTREIAEALVAAGHAVEKREVLLPEGPIHHTGEYDISLLLYTDVLATVKVIIVAAE